VINVVIADDQEMVREGFAALLNAQADITVCAQAADGVEAVAAARSSEPDVVLLDVRMPRMDGLEAAKMIAAEGPARVLMLTTFDLDEYVYAALRAGASGFLLKDAPAAELVHAVRVIASGEALLAPAITRRLIEDFVRQRPDIREIPSLGGLTARETEVLSLVAQGLSNQEIAASLVVAEQTVKTHVSRVLAKLELRDRAQAVIVAYETGLVKPGRHNPR
jgi:DNA-binding NarL/FixJ family response regulator